MAVIRFFFIAFARFSAMIVFMWNIFMMWVSVRIVMNMFILVVVYFFCMLWMNMRNDRFWILMILTIFRRVNMRLMMFFAVHVYTLLSIYRFTSTLCWKAKARLHKHLCFVPNFARSFSKYRFWKICFMTMKHLRLNPIASRVKKRH